jgi:uncharacterized protein YozE (UPF0346 family)
VERQQAAEETSVTFKAWLMLQMKRDDPVGDLALDVHQDRTWPTTQDMVKLRQYVVKRGTLENALTALDRAYSEYQKQSGRLKTPDRR